ncbi:MAG: DUF3617 domain-containing protein [Pseudomonadota bacterium]
MKIKRTIATTSVFALALVACSDNEPSKAASNEETVEAELAQAHSLQPGQYSSNVEIARFEVPGMPAEQAKMVGEMMSSSAAVENSHCLTAEQAGRGGRDMFAELAKGNGSCQFSDFDVDGDHVTGHLRCNGGAGGAQSEMTMVGTMQPTSSDVRMTMAIRDSNLPQGRAEMEMHVTTRRTGDCTVTPATAAQ